MAERGAIAVVSALTAVALAVSACAAAPWLSAPASPPQADQRAFSGGPLDANGLSVYLQMMRELVEGDPITKAIRFRDVAQNATSAPTTTNKLKLALALATPGHPGSNPLEAQQRLSELLDAGAALLPEERMLAAIHLEEVEQRLRLDAQANELRAEAETAEARDSETVQRLDAALAENARLRQQLDEAQQKLNAITNIERQIRERENDANSQ